MEASSCCSDLSSSDTSRLFSTPWWSNQVSWLIDCSLHLVLVCSSTKCQSLLLFSITSFLLFVSLYQGTEVLLCSRDMEKWYMYPYSCRCPYSVSVFFCNISNYLLYISENFCITYHIMSLSISIVIKGTRGTRGFSLCTSDHVMWGVLSEVRASFSLIARIMPSSGMPCAYVVYIYGPPLDLTINIY